MAEDPAGSPAAVDGGGGDLMGEIQTRLAALQERARRERGAMLAAVQEVDPSRAEDAIAAAGGLLPSECAQALREWSQQCGAEAYLQAAQSIKKAHATKHPPNIAAAKRAVLKCDKPGLSTVCAEAIDPLVRALAQQHHSRIRAICAESGWPPPLLKSSEDDPASPAAADRAADDDDAFSDSKLLELGGKVRDSIKALEALEDSGGLGAASALVLEPLRSRVLQVFATPEALALNMDAFALVLAAFAQTYTPRLARFVPLTAAHLLGSLSELARGLVADLCIPVALQLKDSGGGSSSSSPGRASRVLLGVVDNCLVLSRALDKVLREQESDEAEFAALRPMLYSSLGALAGDPAARQLWIDAEEAEAAAAVRPLIAPADACGEFWTPDPPISAAAAGILALARRFEGLPPGQVADAARVVVRQCSLACARSICQQAERRMDECVADGFSSERRVEEAALTCSALSLLADYLLDELSLDPAIAQLESAAGAGTEDEEEVLDSATRALSAGLDAALRRVAASFVKIYSAAAAAASGPALSWRVAAAAHLLPNVADGCAQLRGVLETFAGAAGRGSRVATEVASRCAASICSAAADSAAGGWVDVDRSVAWLQQLKAQLAALLVEARVREPGRVLAGIDAQLDRLAAQARAQQQ